MPRAKIKPLGLRELRQRRFLSQPELAERAGLAVSRVNRLENGRVERPHPSTFRKLAAALDVDPADVLAAFEVSRKEATP
jgi:transcriptional regulator with XRE-family HTH domain